MVIMTQSASFDAVRRDRQYDTPPLTNGAETLTRDFSRVVLTLDTVLLTDDKIKNTPSKQVGISEEVEAQLRSVGCEYIQSACFLLQVPQVVACTAQILFHRFYFSKSFLKHPWEIVAQASVYLSCKVEENCRKIRDILNVFHRIKQIKRQKLFTPMAIDEAYTGAKNQVIKAERRILKELGFSVHGKNPHKFISMLLGLLGMEKNVKLVQHAWNLMNDSLRTDVFQRYKPEVIACACIFIAARHFQIPMPSSPAWYYAFNTSDLEITEICNIITTMYKRPKPNPDQLENELTLLKQKMNEKKVREEARKKAYDDSKVEEMKKIAAQKANAMVKANGPTSSGAPSVSTTDEKPSKHEGDKQRKRSRSPQSRSSSKLISNRRGETHRGDERHHKSDRNNDKERPSSRKTGGGDKDRSSKENRRHRSRSISPHSPNFSSKKRDRHRSPSSSTAAAPPPARRGEKKRYN